MVVWEVANKKRKYNGWKKTLKPAGKHSFRQVFFLHWQNLFLWSDWVVGFISPVEGGWRWFHRLGQGDPTGHHHALQSFQLSCSPLFLRRLKTTGTSPVAVFFVFFACVVQENMTFTWQGHQQQLDTTGWEQQRQLNKPTMDGRAVSTFVSGCGSPIWWTPCPPLKPFKKTASAESWQDLYLSCLSSQKRSVLNLFWGKGSGIHLHQVWS